MYDMSYRELHTNLYKTYIDTFMVVVLTLHLQKSKKIQ